jgi:hypothetical protein
VPPKASVRPTAQRSRKPALKQVGARRLFDNFRLGEEYPATLAAVLAPTHNFALSHLRLDDFPLDEESEFRAMMDGDLHRLQAPAPKPDDRWDSANAHHMLRAMLPKPQRLPSGFYAQPVHWCYGKLLHLVDQAQTRLSAGDKDGAMVLMDKMIAMVAVAGGLVSMSQLFEGFARQWEERHAVRERRSVSPARTRHAKTEKLKEHALRLYEARTWRSVRQAAAGIYPAVASRAKAEGVALSADRGQQTVYEWLLAARKGRRITST